MNKMPNTPKKGDKVTIQGTTWKGVVTKIGIDGNASVLADNGVTMTVGPEILSVISSCTLHDENGKFAPGHPKVGGVKKGYKSIRHYRNALMEQLSPFIEDMGTIIGQIKDPGDKVLAVARMVKYAMPALSSVDFKESAQRDLTAEQKIVQLNAKYNNLPDPTENKDDEDE